MSIPFEKSFASHEKSKYWNVEKNGDVTVRNIFKLSNKKYWFHCDKCSHTFESILSDISRGHWCGYCGNQKLCDDNNCQECFNKSFASHPKSVYWDNEKNGVIKPSYIFKSSAKKYWFNCDNCSHTFDTNLYNINNNDNWCPYCVNQQLCDDDNCKSCFEKSVASLPKSIFWDNEKNGVIKPRDVFKSTAKKYWFNCDKCPHTFDTRLDGSWCPYCVNLKLCNNNNCQSCFEKSFAFHPKCTYWNNEKNGVIKPRDVFKSTAKKYWFNCNKNHLFNSTLYNINNGSWCPYCVNKTEQKLFEKLQPIYPLIITQFKQEWCKNITYLPFDFCIPEHNIIIELDGRQHFIQVSNWQSPEETVKNDLYKQQQAIENGYSIIRLLQEDVYNDTYDWFNELLENIQKIINEKPTIQNIYMCKNNEYSNYEILV